MADQNLRLDEITQKLKVSGHRLTPQRMAVLKILASSAGHPSVEQVYNQVKVDFPMTSLGTVYKTVTLLKEMGEILELGFGEDSHRYDGAKPYPHPHLICVKCNEIIDGDLSLDQESLRSLEQASGYQILRPQISLYGFCPDCKEER
jgi:Fur family peroxide stress response transcriptional regulator